MRGMFWFYQKDYETVLKGRTTVLCINGCVMLMCEFGADEINLSNVRP